MSFAHLVKRVNNLEEKYRKLVAYNGLRVPEQPQKESSVIYMQEDEDKGEEAFKVVNYVKFPTATQDTNISSEDIPKFQRIFNEIVKEFSSRHCTVLVEEEFSKKFNPWDHGISERTVREYFDYDFGSFSMNEKLIKVQKMYHDNTTFYLIFMPRWLERQFDGQKKFLNCNN